MTSTTTTSEAPMHFYDDDSRTAEIEQTERNLDRYLTRSRELTAALTGLATDDDDYEELVYDHEATIEEVEVLQLWLATLTAEHTEAMVRRNAEDAAV